MQPLFKYLKVKRQGDHSDNNFKFVQNYKQYNTQRVLKTTYQWEVQTIKFRLSDGSERIIYLRCLQINLKTTSWQLIGENLSYYMLGFQGPLF
jgi:hypothetical protein